MLEIGCERERKGGEAEIRRPRERRTSGASSCSTVQYVRVTDNCNMSIQKITSTWQQQTADLRHPGSGIPTMA